MSSDRPDRPVMVYDGDCSFCRRWIERWRNLSHDTLEYESYRSAAGKFPQIPIESFQRRIHLIEPRGKTSSGAEAVLRGFKLAGRYAWLLWMYENLPGFAAVSESIYGTIADHRKAADRIDLLLVGSTTEPASHRFTRAIFLHSLGLIYIFAFISLWVQVEGLIGSRGILPVASYLDTASNYFVGSDKFTQLPTLCWFNSSDRFLQIQCAVGAAAGLLIFLGLFQLPALVVAWICYLSLTVAGQVFLEFQWDSLLLEAGFLAIFFASSRLWPRMGARKKAAAEPSHAILWMLRWLVFRVMFMSGVVKLASGDASWRALTAMQFHYETQPLPTWTSWYFFQLPIWFQTFSCGVVFFAELLIPLFIFTPRRLRLVAFWGIISFQLLILATGNYGFFNLLTIVLCFALPDDTFWRFIFRRKKNIPGVVRVQPWMIFTWLRRAIALVLLSLTIPPFVGAFGVAEPWFAPVRWLENCVESFRITSSYGLFAIMTTSRPEIIVQGSDDGRTWKDYVFKWKPGDLARAPLFTTPHLPRLDWQMWFAALGDSSQNPWFIAFTHRLLQGSGPVLELLQTNPFPDHPPLFIRGVLFDYSFTDRSVRRATGDWWTRQPQSLYYETVRTPRDQQ